MRRAAWEAFLWSVRCRPAEGSGRLSKRIAVAGGPLRDSTTIYSCLMTGLYELRFFMNLCYNMNWLGNTLFMCLTCFLKMQAGRFRPAALKLSFKRFFENHFLAKDEKWWKYMIRPAKCHFNGFVKPFIKGADKNHNPRKGTETNHSLQVVWLLCLHTIRTIIPARGRKRPWRSATCSWHPTWIRTIIPARGRKPTGAFW